MVEVESVVQEGLGHSSYVVDPTRFPDQQRQLAAGPQGWSDATGIALRTE